MTSIETARLLLRNWQASDLAAFVAMNRDAEVMRYFPALLTEEQSLVFYSRIQQHIASHGFGLYAVIIKETRAFAGFTGCMIPAFEASFTPCVEIGWRFNKRYWGQGLAKEAALACLEFGFTKLGFEEIVSFTSIHNHPSEKLMQKIGMQHKQNFMHPKLPLGDFLCEHVLYTLSKQQFLERVTGQG